MAKRKLKNLRVLEVSLVDKGAGKGVQVMLLKSRGGPGSAVTLRVPFHKVDEEKRQVFGWAYVSKAHEAAEQVVDHHEHVIEVEDLEAAAYEFMLSSRMGGEMHESAEPGDPSTVHQRSRCIESFVTTVEKQRAMGLHGLPIGWWIGFQIDDESTWQKVRAGDLQEFSIAGMATEVPMDGVPPKSRGAWERVRTALGFRKDDAAPRTLAEIVDGQRVREQTYALSEALMCSVSEITWSGSITAEERVAKLKETVEQFGERMGAIAATIGAVEKAAAQRALDVVEDVIAKLEASDQVGAQAVIEKAHPRTTNPRDRGTKEKDMQAKDIIAALAKLSDADRQEIVKALAAPAPAPVEKDLPDDARDAFAKLREANAALEKRLQDAVDRLNKAEDEKATAECVKLAASYQPLGVDAAELATTFKALRGTPAFDVQKKALDAALAKVVEANKGLVTARGRDGGAPHANSTGAYAQLEQKAKDLAKAESTSFEKAMRRVVAENADLYRRHVMETRSKGAAMFDDPADGAAADD